MEIEAPHYSSKSNCSLSIGVENRSAPTDARRRLFTKEDLAVQSIYRTAVPPWAFRSMTGYLLASLDPDFPCNFAGPKLWRGFYRFAFLPDARTLPAAEQLGATLSDYLTWLATVPVADEPYAVLIAFFEATPTLDEPEYRAVFERVLQRTNFYDPAPWPRHLPQDANHSESTFCFGGRELFVNANTPAHLHRRSRNLGPSLTLVIQPRDAFDKIANAKLRDGIRARIPKFDGIPASPEIGSFGDDRNREFNGYFLSDDNDEARRRFEATKVCPFRAATERAKESLSRSPHYRVVRALHHIKNYVRNFFSK
jgi:FPC/CPF motif-containing protein YcgG